VIAIHKKSDLYPISCFPNPASDVLNILFNNSGNNNVSIIIYDISGREIIREEKVVSEGSNILTLETNALSSGSYSVSLLNSRNEILARDLLNKIKNRNSPTTFDHPWFGAFTAAQWFWLLGTHQAIHRAQIRKIKEILNH
jgi:hypothetical protein